MSEIDKEVAGISKKHLSFKEACNYTGFSASYLYKLTSSKKLPHFKPGGKLVYFLIADIDQYLLRNRVSSLEEIEEDAINYVNKR